MTKEEPPAEKNGKVIPVRGVIPEIAPKLIKAWLTKRIKIPKPTSFSGTEIEASLIIDQMIKGKKHKAK